MAREDAVSRVVHWFKIIVQRRLLPFLRTVDWSALWQRVGTNVEEFLRARGHAVSHYLGYGLGFGIGFGIAVGLAVGLAILVRTAFSRRSLTRVEAATQVATELLKHEVATEPLAQVATEPLAQVATEPLAQVATEPRPTEPWPTEPSIRQMKNDCWFG